MRPSKSFYPKKISVGLRDSPLSFAQMEEVLSLLQKFDPEIQFEPTFVKTKGDLDKKSSLRNLDKTDFFTKEIDEMLLNGKVQVAIHSAKDLPEPILRGLKIAAITKGLDPSDSLVFRENESLWSLKNGAIVGTSSIRREESVRKLRDDLQFMDIRGTISERLEELFSHHMDALVVASSALIRLKLTHLNSMKLEGETAPMQGRLALLTRADDLKMQTFLKLLDYPL